MSPQSKEPLRAVEQIQSLVSAKLGARNVTGRVLVAVSGGQDSVTLLHTVVQVREDHGIEPIVGHVDHLLNRNSTIAAFSVRRLCQSLGIEFLMRSVDVRQHMYPSGESNEMAARRFRYQALREMRRECGAQRILLGHTADDQAETVLMRMLRGTGTVGLAAMAESEGDLLRPLLEVWRRETAEYCRSVSLQVASDPSNEDDGIVRNQLRNVTIPALEVRFPAARRSLSRLATSAGRDGQFLERVAREALEVITVDGEINAHLWAALSPSIRYHAVRLRSVSKTGYPQPAHRLDAIVKTLASRAQRDANVLLPPTGIAGLPLFCSQEVSTTSSLKIPGRVVVDNLLFDAAILEFNSSVKARVSSTSYWDAYLDAALSRDLTVRMWRPGDRMQPLGSSGSRKLQDIFVDRHIPQPLRSRLPVVCGGDGIVWVPGVTLDARHCVTAATTRVLHIAVRKVLASGSNPT